MKLTYRTKNINYLSHVSIDHLLLNLDGNRLKILQWLLIQSDEFNPSDKYIISNRNINKSELQKTLKWLQDNNWIYRDTTTSKTDNQGRKKANNGRYTEYDTIRYLYRFETQELCLEFLRLREEPYDNNDTSKLKEAKKYAPLNGGTYNANVANEKAIEAARTNKIPPVKNDYPQDDDLDF